MLQPGARGGAAWGACGVAAARAAPLLVVGVEVLAAARPLHLLQHDLEREIRREVEPDVDGRLDRLAGQHELGALHPEHAPLVLLAVHLDLVVELRELGARDLVQRHVEGAEQVGPATSKSYTRTETLDLFSSTALLIAHLSGK